MVDKGYRIEEYNFTKKGKLIRRQYPLFSAIFAVILSVILIVLVFLNIYIDNGLYNIFAYSSSISKGAMSGIITACLSHFIEIFLLYNVIKKVIFVIKTIIKEEKKKLSNIITVV